MKKFDKSEGYGVIDFDITKNESEIAVEEIKRNGFAKIKSNFTNNEINSFSKKLDIIQKKYRDLHGLDFLKSINEEDQIRLPMSLDISFLDIVKDKNLNSVLKKLIPGRYILNQQNGVVNPPKKRFDQAKWHRDLPYQHYTSDKPLAINALLCLDDFSLKNGATGVIPGSHLHSSFPSSNFVENNHIQIEAQKGYFLVLDSMLYHRAEKNLSTKSRRAVNNVFGIPFFKQQINIRNSLSNYKLSKKDELLLGYDIAVIPKDIPDFLDERFKKQSN